MNKKNKYNNNKASVYFSGRYGETIILGQG